MAYKKDVTLAKSMGSIIRALRQEKHQGHGGQIKCAVDFGVSQSEWSHWERGTKTPSAVNQKRIAEYFGVKVGYLWGEKTDPPASQPAAASSPVSASLVPPKSYSTSTESGSFILDLYRLVTRVQTRILSLANHAESSPAVLSHALTTLTVVDNTLERTSPDRFPPSGPSPSAAGSPPCPPPVQPIRPPAYAPPPRVRGSEIYGRHPGSYGKLGPLDINKSDANYQDVTADVEGDEVEV